MLILKMRRKKIDKLWGNKLIFIIESNKMKIGKRIKRVEIVNKKMNEEERIDVYKKGKVMEERKEINKEVEIGINKDGNKRLGNRREGLGVNIGEEEGRKKNGEVIEKEKDKEKLEIEKLKLKIGIEKLGKSNKRKSLNLSIRIIERKVENVRKIEEDGGF